MQHLPCRKQSRHHLLSSGDEHPQAIRRPNNDYNITFPKQRDLMIHNADTPFKYEAAMQAFLAEMEWTDTLDCNFDDEFVCLNTQISIGGNNHQLIVECRENDLIDIYVYLRHLSVKPSKDDQMHILLSHLNSRIRVGAFQFVREADWHFIRWHHATDFEGSNPTGTTIRLQVVTGLNTVHDHADPIAAVALTNQTAATAIDEFNQSRQKDGENTH